MLAQPAHPAARKRVRRVRSASVEKKKGRPEMDIAKWIEFLKGKKTYIIAAGAILTALGGYLDGKLDGMALALAVMGALGLGTLRAGVAKGAPPTAPLIAVFLAFNAALFTGCETSSAASGVAAIAPAARTIQRGCDIAETWISYVAQGVGVVGDAAGKVAGAVAPVKTAAVTKSEGNVCGE
jgi:hypothetical protein